MSKIKFIKHILVCFLFISLVFSCATSKNVKDSGKANNKKTDPVMVYYEGELLNIFFHALIARPEIAFWGSRKDHYKEWFVTADEYKKILDELYLQNYVLVDIKEFYTVTYTNKTKTVKANKLLVPPGKKPLVLSVDDLSYYESNRRNGTVHKLIIDKNGNIAAWTDTSSGGEVSYDLDIITITEDFIKKHPDFSVRGAKGIIAPTGFEGVLGYRTQGNNSNSAGYQKEIENAVKVANKLKELGWRFASHSYRHLNMPKVTMAAFLNDINLWDKEVKPILGETDLYIYPYGAALDRQDEKHKILRERNYNLFFGVGDGYGYRVGPRSEYIYLTRRNIDGCYFRLFRNSDKKLFDIDKVMDKKNRGIK
jgi:hypothetical protein